MNLQGTVPMAEILSSKNVLIIFNDLPQWSFYVVETLVNSYFKDLFFL